MLIYLKHQILIPYHLVVGLSRRYCTNARIIRLHWLQSTWQTITKTAVWFSTRERGLNIQNSAAIAVFKTTKQPQTLNYHIIIHNNGKNKIRGKLDALCIIKEGGMGSSFTQRCRNSLQHDRMHNIQNSRDSIVPS